MSVLSDCITRPFDQLLIFNPLPPGGSSSALTNQGPKPPVRSKFLPMSHCVVLRSNSRTEPYVTRTITRATHEDGVGRGQMLGAPADRIRIISASSMKESRSLAGG